jgi:outer membrane immunogenic protein
MKMFLVSNVAAIGAAIVAPNGPASAADMPAIAADMPTPYYKTSPLPVAPITNWSGFYVGGNVGYGWGDPGTNAAGNGTAPFFSVLPPFQTFPFNFAFTDSNTARLNGVIGGGQIGYNYQLTRSWVLGLEADFQGSGQRGSSAFGDQISAPVCTVFGAGPPSCLATTPFAGTAATAYEAKIDWFGTVRGRAGFLLTDQILLYGTGGLAYGRVEVSGNSTATNAGLPNVPLTGTGGAFTAAKTNVGFTVGGGVEGKLSPWLPANWSWKLEYLYLDLGSLNSPGSFGVVNPAGGLLLPGVGAVALHTHFMDNIVRVGVNYKFGN